MQRLPSAAMPSGVYLSSASLAPSANGAKPGSFTDHYVTLGLDCDATSEEIKAAFRQLRGEFFRTDAEKYRQLQAAYAVLVDWEARREYDVIYRTRVGLPAPPPSAPSLASSECREDGGEEDEEEVRDRDDPNYHLKHFVPRWKPLLGTRPYASYVPVLEVYGQREMHPKLMCARPKSVGGRAKNALP